MQGFRAEVVSRRLLVLVGHVQNIQVEAFLLVLANQVEGRSILFVTQEVIEAVAMLGKKGAGGVLARRERSAVDDSPQLSAAENQGVLQRRHLLIDADLVLVHAVAPHEATLISRFLHFARIAGGFTDAAALDPIPANLCELFPAAVKKYGRLRDLFRRKVFLILIDPGRGLVRRCVLLGGGRREGTYNSEKDQDCGG